MSMTAPGTDVPAVTPLGSKASWAERKFRELLAGANVAVGGSRPWDVRVNDERLFRRVVMDGVVGLGDAYVDGWWDCDALDQLFDRALTHDVPDRIPFDRHSFAWTLKHRVANLQTVARARRSARSHYDLGNDLFESMLDRRMCYTCGYWREATSLDAAQEAKLDLVCRKIGLRGGQRVLDLGCGWGSFVGYAAERYGAAAVGVTVAEEQVKLGRERYSHLPIELRLQDYREVDETFDHIVSIGMLEHVGPKNYRTMMRLASRCLRDDGLFLMHAFAGRESFPNSNQKEVSWIDRHIFPGLIIPSMKQIGAAIDGLFVVEDVHNFGADYDPTLMAWFANFDRAWPGLSTKYGERFYRMWKYYLLSCAGAFRSRKYQLWQFVLSKRGVRGGYVSVR